MTTWVLIVFMGIGSFGAGITSQKVEGFKSAESCDRAKATFLRDKGRLYEAYCIAVE